MRCIWLFEDNPLNTHTHTNTHPHTWSIWLHNVLYEDHDVCFTYYIFLHFVNESWIGNEGCAWIAVGPIVFLSLIVIVPVTFQHFLNFKAERACNGDGLRTLRVLAARIDSSCPSLHSHVWSRGHPRVIDIRNTDSGVLHA